MNATDTKMTAVVNDIFVQLEDDGFPVTMINCRCLHTGATETFTYPSEYFDAYRYQDQWAEIQPNLFAVIAESVASDFVDSLVAQGVSR